MDGGCRGETERRVLIFVFRINMWYTYEQGFCKLLHYNGELIGVLADESVLDETGKVDATKLNAFVFDQFRNGYYAIGEKVGQAWHTGPPLMKV